MRIALGFLAAVMLLAVMPSAAEAQTNQCETACCYCDLAVGQCKDISEFPVGGGTGYTNCYINGMSCYYWGTSCVDEFAFEEVGPDGMLRFVAASTTEAPVGEPPKTTTVWVDGVQLERDCRRFIVGIKSEPADVRAYVRRTTALTL